jgi:ubiquinone/menaquinone biosynthesis C-methylase UbiE
MDRDEYRRENLKGWNTIAPGWERQQQNIARVGAPVQQWLLQELDPQPGQTILELAAGPGETGFAAAALLGDEGRLISTDFSPEMVEVARRRAAELGLHNVEHRAMDAERLDLADDSVDGIICRWGFMLMADPAAALAETRRVLRRGGRLVLAVWRAPEQNPWIAVGGRVFVGHGLLPPPDPAAPSMFAMATDERVRSLLQGAGFESVRIDDVPVLFVYESVADYLTTAKDTAGSVRRALGEASEEQLEAITEALEEAFAPFAVDSRYKLPGLSLVALAS